MAKIIPIRLLKDTVEISRQCHSAPEPLFITKRGFGDMVIMSSEYYEALMNSVDVVKLSENLAKITEKPANDPEDDWDDERDADPLQ